MNLTGIRPLALLAALAIFASACSDDTTDDGAALATETTAAATTRPSADGGVDGPG